MIHHLLLNVDEFPLTVPAHLAAPLETVPRPLLVAKVAVVVGVVKRRKGGGANKEAQVLLLLTSVQMFSR